jgi:hypothetical protein
MKYPQVFGLKDGGMEEGGRRNGFADVLILSCADI